jgi:hypothetical protein
LLLCPKSHLLFSDAFRGILALFVHILSFERSWVTSFLLGNSHSAHLLLDRLCDDISHIVWVVHKLRVSWLGFSRLRGLLLSGLVHDDRDHHRGLRGSLDLLDRSWGGHHHLRWKLLLLLMMMMVMGVVEASEVGARCLLQLSLEIAFGLSLHRLHRLRVHHLDRRVTHVILHQGRIRSFPR